MVHEPSETAPAALEGAVASFRDQCRPRWLQLVAGSSSDSRGSVSSVPDKLLRPC